jgi:hypothetical protein
MIVTGGSATGLSATGACLITAAGNAVTMRRWPSVFQWKMGDSGEPLLLEQIC